VAPPRRGRSHTRLARMTAELAFATVNLTLLPCMTMILHNMDTMNLFRSVHNVATMMLLKGGRTAEGRTDRCSHALNIALTNRSAHRSQYALKTHLFTIVIVSARLLRKDEMVACPLPCVCALDGDNEKWGDIGVNTTTRTSCILHFNNQLMLMLARLLV
jgi:hypothetical protein